MSNLIRKIKRQKKIRKLVIGQPEKPRLSVYRSNKYLYVQLIDDSTHKTLVATNDKKLQQEKSRLKRAHAVGANLAKTAVEKKIKNVVFDRSGYRYHGRVKALADGAREGGLNF